MIRRAPLKRKPKKRQRSLPTLRKLAWSTFSWQVRTEGKTRTFNHCVTCGMSYPVEELHAGHFIHCSKQSALSYDERNIHPQCRQCNYYGMQGLAAIKYTQYMQDRYGPGIVDELIAMKHAKEYLKRADLEQIIIKHS